MGSSSKVLLVGATSLIVGVYAISLKNVQTAGMQTAQSHVNRMQEERLVDAAVIMAINDVKNSGGNENKAVTGAHALGADITYSISGANGNHANIFLTITKGGFTTTVKAKVERISGSHGPKQGMRKLHRGIWQLTNAFVQRG